MTWVMSQDKREMVDVVSIQLSAPINESPTPRKEFGLIGICVNRQLHNLGTFFSKEQAQKEMWKFGICVRAFQIGEGGD